MRFGCFFRPLGKLKGNGVSEAIGNLKIGLGACGRQRKGNPPGKSCNTGWHPEAVEVCRSSVHCCNNNRSMAFFHMEMKASIRLRFLETLGEVRDTRPLHGEALHSSQNSGICCRSGAPIFGNLPLRVVGKLRSPFSSRLGTDHQQRGPICRSKSESGRTTWRSSRRVFAFFLRRRGLFARHGDHRLRLGEMVSAGLPPA